MRNTNKQNNKQIYYLTTNKYIISQQTNILSHNKQIYYLTTNKYIISQQTNILSHNKQIYYLTTNKYINSQQTNILSHNKQIYYLTTNKYIISQQTNRKQKTTFFFFIFCVTNFVPCVAGFLPASLQNVQIGRTTACMFCNSIISTSFARTAPEFPPQ